jgi:hypothetical protein
MATIPKLNSVVLLNGHQFDVIEHVNDVAILKCRKYPTWRESIGPERYAEVYKASKYDIGQKFNLHGTFYYTIRSIDYDNRIYICEDLSGNTVECSWSEVDIHGLLE